MISKSLSTLALVTLTAVALSLNTANASVVDLGQAGQFALLALGGDIQDSGPTGPQGNPYSVNGAVGIATAGHKFQTSGDRTYNGPVYLHTGSSFNSSAHGTPPPVIQNSQTDAMLAQAVQDAINASSFAASLSPTQTFTNIDHSLTISEGSTGHFVFNINAINLHGGEVLTLNGTANSTFLLNVSNGLTLSPGSILLSGGLTSDNVLINYTGHNTISTSGGGNSSQIYGTLLAPYAHVQMTPGYVSGSIIADSITLSSGANIVPVPEFGTLFPVIGLVAAVVSTHALRRRKEKELAAAGISSKQG